MKEPVRLLLVDDKPDDRALIVAELQTDFPELMATEVSDQRTLHEALWRGEWDLVVTDNQLGWSSGLEVLRTIKSRQSDCPVIMFASSGNAELAVEAMKAGVDEYLTRSIQDLAQLRAAARMMLEQRANRLAMQTTEIQYRDFFNNVPVGLIVVAPDGQIIDANPAMVTILGFASREDLVGLNVAKFSIDRETATRYLAQIETRGEMIELEVELARRDGNSLWLLLSARVARDESGKLLYYQAAAEDITDRKRAEEAVHESEQRFEAFMDRAPVLVFIKDEKGRYEYANEPWRQLFRRRPEQLYGKTDFDLMPREVAERLREHDRTVIESGHLSETLVQLPDADGAMRSWMVLKFPIKDPEERNFIGGFAIDITERQRVEEHGRRTEQRFRDLFESSPDAIFVEDLQGNVLDVNPAACRLHGCKREDLVGKNVIDLVPADRRSEVAREFPHLAAGELNHVESTSLTLDGRAIPVSINASRFEYQGQPAVLLHVRDMSEQQRLQEQFLQSQKMEAIGRLAGGIAHDFNNLLTAIIGYNELVLQGISENEGLRENAEEVQRAARRAAKLTRQLLAFSRKQTLRPRVLDLNHVVLELEKMLRRLLGADVDLVVVPVACKACVKADPSQVEQVLINLAVNARDAMPNGGMLTVRITVVTVTTADLAHREVPEGEYVLLTMSDTGAGMSEEVRRRLFEPFFTTKAEGKGTGLGLATCYGIIKQSGGRIHCESSPGAGTTFFIYLPRVRATEPSKPLPPPGFETEKLPKGTETLLLVEDNPAVRELAARVLRTIGYTVLEAEDGEHALRVIDTHGGSDRIHLVITDVMMPVMGGKELVERFRSAKPDAKVLFNSGSIEDDIGLQEVLRRKGTAFLHKPFTPVDLAIKVREMLDSNL